MILVVTPLPIERKLLASDWPSELDHVRFETGGHGKVAFALRAQELIMARTPKLVICAGACGALSPRVQPHDVVVAEKTIEHDFKIRMVDQPPPEFPGDPQALERLKGIPFDFPVHFGPMASGDEDVVGSERAQEIARKTSALAVAWEGAGGARACKHRQIPFLEIRGVTDRADSATMEAFRENLPQAMARVSAVLRRLVE